MYVLAIDQGTTGTTTVLYSRAGEVVAKAYREFPQIYPRPGWVEHGPVAIWDTVVETVTEVVGDGQREIVAVGITNQRETSVLWHGATGQPVHNAIVWQCRRTADICRELAPQSDRIRQLTGLPVDAYFSGTKIKWLLDNVPEANDDDVLFGTIDTWLIWKLTGGQVHATDFTNASRTMVFDIRRRQWSDELCELLRIPRVILPDVRRSVGDYGVVRTIPALEGVPILGVAGDQQAALFGQAGFAEGQMKNTYGTGCFTLMNTGDTPVESSRGLITTVAVSGDGGPCYALEGSVFVAGAVIQWLRDELGILESAAESEALAASVEDNAGVYVVPAFVGLGAPHWDMDARGIIVGLTRGANRGHVVRAALESMAYQSYDVIAAMEAETGLRAPELAVDGGAVANDFLMQFQADILGKPVVRPAVIESTSLGAAYMAGLAAGVWCDAHELSRLKKQEATFRPDMDDVTRQRLLAGWRKALRQAMTR